MRRFLATLAVAAALIVPNAGCAALPDLNKPLLAQTVKDEQLALGVEIAFKSATYVIETGVDVGLIKGARATQVRSIYGEGKRLRDLAVAADNLGQAAEFNAKAAAARDLFDKVWSLATGRAPA